MAGPDLKQSVEQLKQLYFRLKSDPALLVEIRSLVMGLVVCAAVAYAGFTLFLEPQQKKIRDQVVVRDRLATSASVESQVMLANRRRQLQQELEKIEEEQEILVLKKSFYLEQWQDWADIDRFTGVVLTLDEAAPVSLGKNLRQLSHQEARSRDGFTSYPIRLAGTATFQEIFDYLRYLENREEIRLIDELTITRLPAEGYEQDAKVEFSLMVGRMGMEKRGTP